MKKTFLIKNLFLFFFFFMGLGISLGQKKAEKLEGIIAWVGDIPISKLELEKEISLSSKENSNSSTIDSCTILEKLLIKKLITYHAKSKINEKNDQEVRNNIKKEMERMINSIKEDKKEIVLAQYGFANINQLKEELYQNKIQEIYLEEQRRDLENQIDITPEEVKDFYSRYQDKLGDVPEEIYIRDMVFRPKTKTSQKKELLNKLSELKKEIEQGESFETKAMLYSKDMGSSKEGGLIKNIRKGHMDKKFQSVAFSLKEGEISNPFESDFGFHIIKVEKKNKNTQEIDLRHILLRPEYTTEQLDEIEAFIVSIRKDLLDKKTTFDALLKKYAPDNKDQKEETMVDISFTPLRKIEKSQLPLNAFMALIDLEQGAISPHYKEEEQESPIFLLTELNKVIPSHKASLKEDYPIISNLAKMEKLEKKQDEWIKNKIKQTPIELSKDIKTCSFFYTWYK